MKKLREHVKGMKNEELFTLWQLAVVSSEIPVLAVSAIIEAELERRGLIKLNEDTFEYEILK